MKRRKPVVGLSLKVYQNNAAPSTAFAQRIVELSGTETAVEQFYCPGMGVIYPVAQVLKGSQIGLGSQNIGPVASGAYTGEFSIESLKELGGTYVEIGHSERRINFQETESLIHQKILLTLAYQMIPVFCIGEPQKSSVSEREPILARQLYNALSFIPLKDLAKVIVAYEPVWAIGESLAASSPYVSESHQLIRQTLATLFSPEVAESVRIIYGGSVSQENVSQLVSDKNVDGVFVGRFGHDPKRYAKIVQLVKEAKEREMI